MRRKQYTEKQLNILLDYYPDGNWDQILPYFPGKSKADIRAIARKNNIRRKQKREQDIAGERFGKLVVIKPNYPKDKYAKWLCKCDCGNDVTVSIYSLLSGTTKSCGCLKSAPAKNAKDLTGQRFGLLTAVERLPRYEGNKTFYRCICSCEREKIVYAGNLHSGHTRSCGVQHHKKEDFANLPEGKLDDKYAGYAVYRHVSPSGKSYIGITKQNPERRFQNGCGYRTQIVFYRAIQKYGWENFRHEILETNLTEKEACQREAFYIEKVYKSFAPNGYNTREGGIAGRNYVTPVLQYYEKSPVNFFESISEAARELGIAQHTIHIHCGHENAVHGYYFQMLDAIAPYNIDSHYFELYDPKHFIIKELIAEDHRRTTIVRNKNSSRAINMYDLDGHYLATFESIIAAQNGIGKPDGGAIHAAVNPNRQGHTAYGYMWKYDGGTHADIAPVDYVVQKAVLQIEKETGTVIKKYKSMSDAAKALGVSMYKIRVACNGRDKSFEKFILRFEDN